MKLLFIILFSFVSLYAQATEFGLASVYSDAYDGGQTSSGELYKTSALTAAHKTLPYGSVVKVTNMLTKKVIRVRINDRGPFIKGYVIELSKAAADALKIKGNKGKVKLEVEKRGDEKIIEETKETPEEYDASKNNPFSEVEKETVTTKTEDTGSGKIKDPIKSENELVEETKKAEEKSTPVVKKEPTKTPVKTSTKPSKNTAKTNLVPLKTKGFKKYDLYKVSTFEPKGTGYAVQVGLYKDFTNVLRQTAILQENWFSNIMLVRKKKNPISYTLLIGPFDELPSANHYLKDMKKKGVDGFVSAVQAKANKEIYQIKALRLKSDAYAVQIMNLKDEDNVILEIDKLRKQWFKNILLHVVKGENGKTNYKILLGPLPDKERADAYVKSLKKDKGMDSFPVDLSTIQ